MNLLVLYYINNDYTIYIIYKTQQFFNINCVFNVCDDFNICDAYNICNILYF